MSFSDLVAYRYFIHRFSVLFTDLAGSTKSVNDIFCISHCYRYIIVTALVPKNDSPVYPILLSFYASPVILTCMCIVLLYRYINVAALVPKNDSSVYPFLVLVL